MSSQVNLTGIQIMKIAAICAAFWFWHSPAVAHVSDLPQWVQDVLNETGPGWLEDRRRSIEKTREAFTALHRTMPDGDLIVHLVYVHCGKILPSNSNTSLTWVVESHQQFRDGTFTCATA